jgi:hypothetical protein
MNKEIKIRKKLRDYKKNKNTKIIKGGVNNNVIQAKGSDIKRIYKIFGLKLYKDQDFNQELTLEEYYNYTLDNSNDIYYISVFDETRFKNLDLTPFKSDKEINILKGLNIKKNYENFGLKLYKDADLTQELSLKEYYNYTLDDSDDIYHISIFDTDKFKNISIKMFKTEKEIELLIKFKNDNSNIIYRYNDDNKYDGEFIAGYNVKCYYKKYGLKLYKNVDLTEELSLEEYYNYTLDDSEDYEDINKNIYYISVFDIDKFKQLNLKEMKYINKRIEILIKSLKIKNNYDTLGLKLVDKYDIDFTVNSYFDFTFLEFKEYFRINLVDETKFKDNIDIIKDEVFEYDNIIFINSVFLITHVNTHLQFNYRFDTHNIQNDSKCMLIIINNLVNLIKYLYKVENIFGSKNLLRIDTFHHLKKEYTDLKIELIELYSFKLKEYKFNINMEDLNKQKFNIQELFKINFMQNEKSYSEDIKKKLNNVELTYDNLSVIDFDLIITDKILYYAFNKYTLDHLYLKLLSQLELMYKSNFNTTNLSNQSENDIYIFTLKIIGNRINELNGNYSLAICLFCNLIKSLSSLL